MKRILENRLHKGARLHVDHADFSLCRFQHDRAVPGRTRWIIYRPEQARFEIKKSDDVFLVPNMIAGGEDRNARAQKFNCDLPGDPAPAGRVLTVHNYEIDRVLLL